MWGLRVREGIEDENKKHSAAHLTGVYDVRDCTF